jgi:hypothetical protein
MENECTTDSDLMSGPEGKTPSELDAIIADYHHKVKDSRMQAIIRRREETDKCIQMEAAYAFEVSTHIPGMAKAGRYGNIRRPTGISTEVVKAALKLEELPQVHAGILTPRAWLHAVNKAYCLALPEPRQPRTPTPAAPAPRPARRQNG